ncbi:MULTISPECIES: acyl-CoA dehydrogenase family protein [unclassified Pseudofrankia]|uniref:acyl-CoA dehydrogenase family protein n=1 Tax=unclassified Pseudofrankia TaxID=2994372 RepID=UPI0008D9A4A5|nr:MULTISPECIES: acyl-CoA dehydrogenase family protein [unclassified Pseudofrankia]MDT3442190.1 acyl-CoA dehydrogenase family protein [Pseudofrankia sp. BMG5.37]OHV43593.1 acyl-CoA dehydrogenase [Pseudofrankia sp. BMG5.36]
MTTQDTGEVEDLDGFRQRARAFVRVNLRPADPAVVSARLMLPEEETLAAVARERELQRMLFDAGLAGICVPREYGGQGLTPDHQQVLNSELAGYEYPMRLQIPTFVPCAAVLFDRGTEEQKQRHLPAILKGDELWVQFLSEPSGGSDMAGALTNAVRDGDEWVLNGSKLWTTNASWSDWALCLARTNWDVPKHRGLTVFMLPIRQPGIEIRPIEMLNGSKEFCQEFLTDVRVPDSHRVGDVDDGWSVCIRWMFHERMLFNSPLLTIPAGAAPGSVVSPTSMRDIARDAARLQDPAARDLVGEAYMLTVAKGELERRLREGIAAGVLSDQAAAIGRVFGALVSTRTTDIAFELAGDTGVAWANDDGTLANRGTDFLMRQAGCIGGGTAEMARNVISERVLGMPREPAADRGIAFRDAPRSHSART